MQLTGTIATASLPSAVTMQRLEHLVVIEPERLGRLPTEVAQRFTTLVLEHPELDACRFEGADRRRHQR